MTVNCFRCDKEFKTFPAWLRRGRGKFCSVFCNAKYHSENLLKANDTRKAKGIKGGRPRGGQDVSCSVCNKLFYKPPSQGQKYCSMKCRDKYSEINPRKRKYVPVHSTRGENHYNWKGGRSFVDRRCLPEYREWRKSVFHRDKFCCVQCGVRGSRKVMINADHIKPFALYPELAYDINNGRTLCFDCHKKTPTYGMNKRYIKPASQSKLFAV